MNGNVIYYYNSLKKLHLPVSYLPEMNACELVLGGKHYFFSWSETPFNHSTAASISQNKYQTNLLLRRAGIPVPKAVLIHIDAYKTQKVEELLGSLSFPLVVKPVDSGLGIDVVCNIKNLELLEAQLANHFSRYNEILLEEFHGQLNSYRVLIFNKKIIGVLHCYPPQVEGDGVHSVQELIDLTNNQRKNNAHYLSDITITPESHIRLSEQGIRLDDIPKINEIVFLGYVSNAGGVYRAISPKVCNKNKKLLIRAARVTGLHFVGIDVECVDLNIPIESSGGVIIETNHNPGIVYHELPCFGTPNPVSFVLAKSFIFRQPFAYLIVLFKKIRLKYF